MESAATASRRYRFLDVLVEVRSERRETLALLDSLYSPFGSESDGPPDLRADVRREGGSLRMEIDGRSWPLAPPPVADFHAYTVLFSEFLQHVQDQFFVHGAAVGRGSRTLILAGPSGHGKTTLSLALAGRGFAFLSDDFAPVQRRDGRVHPFPKSVGVRREAGAPGSDAAALPDGTGSRVAFGDKWLLDPAGLPGGVAAAPRKLTHLLLLSAGDAGREPITTYRLALVEGQGELEKVLRDLPGVDVSSTTTPGGRPALTVRLSGGPASRMRFHDACSAHRHGMLLFEPERPPVDFDGEVEIEAMGALPAALELMREVLNRAPGGGLGQASGGDMAPLVMELAGVLRDVRCARLRPGDLDATAAAILSWMDEEEAE